MKTKDRITKVIKDRVESGYVSWDDYIIVKNFLEKWSDEEMKMFKKTDYDELISLAKNYEYQTLDRFLV